MRETHTSKWKEKRMMNSMWLLLLLLLLECSWTTAREDVYREELVIKRLPSQNLIANFRFTTDSPRFGSSFDLFPRVMGELITHYDVAELHLSLSLGFWRTDQWGFAPQPAAPSGAQLSVWFRGNQSSVDERWTNLVHALSGLFCASLVQIVPSLSSSPRLAFRPWSAVVGGEVHSEMGRYAALSSENVCTENLTPWKKLLPCKEAGLSSLLHPIKFYGAQYHSMSVDVIRLCPHSEPSCSDPAWRITQSLVVVTDIPLGSKVLNWNLQSLFDGRVTRKCSLASSSKILVEAEDQIKADYSQTPDATLTFRDGRRLAVFDLLTAADFPVNIGAKYQERLSLRAVSLPSLSVHNYVGGSGQQSGQLVTRLVNTASTGQRLVYAHLIPWFLRVYYHSLLLDCGEGTAGGRVVSKRFKPARDRLSPYLLELDLDLPPQSTCHLSLDFDKCFLRWTEYPPDANKGFFVPAPSVLFRPKDWANVSVLGGPRTTALEELQGQMTSPLVLLYGEALLVGLPVPDFSMPYNVICLVCTVIALCFGPVHSLTTKSLVMKFENKADPPKTLLGRALKKVKESVAKLLKRKPKEPEEEKKTEESAAATEGEEAVEATEEGEAVEKDSSKETTSAKAVRRRTTTKKNTS